LANGGDSLTSGLPTEGREEGMLTIEQLGPLPIPLEPRSIRPTVVIVVPAHNEEEVLALAFAEIKRVMDSLAAEWSVIFVNDGSRDSTLDALEKLYQGDDRVSYISLSRNFGHQSALAAGLDHAVGDVVVTMDADLQHPPNVIPTLLRAWQQGYDIVHTRKVATTDIGRVRKVVTRLAYRAIGATASVEFIAQASDFRLLDAHAQQAIRDLPERGRLYRGLARWVGFRQAVVPFHAARRVAGSPSYGFRQLASLFGRAFFDFSNVPLRLALFLGTFAIVLCMAYLAFVLVAYIVGKAIPPGFVSLIFVFAFLSSVNLTMIGVLGVYVARIHEEVRARPTYVVARNRMRGLATPR
jgi:glycosyltransferase involved in cell wall biosynthesis